MKLWKNLGLLAVLIIISGLSLLKFGEFSWVIIFLATFIYLLVTGNFAITENVKIITFNLAAVFFALFLYEGFLLYKLKTAEDEGIRTLGGDYVTNEFMAAHSYLGFGVRGDGQFTSDLLVDNELVYDVIYEVRNGLRYTPNSNHESGECVLFFGCSFTFGEGVADTSTLPFYFNQYSHRKQNTLNYGFFGYGSHQMLSFIENRVPADIRNCSTKKLAIYSYLPKAHIARAAGYSTWDQYGPEYKMVDGRLVKTGAFSSLPPIVNHVLLKSLIYRTVFIERKPTHDDLLLTIEIVKKSGELLKNNQTEFYVFVWDNLNEEEKEETGHNLFLDEMAKAKIRTFLLSEAIPDYDKNEEAYILHKSDKHPNGLANKKIAAYLSEKLNSGSTE